MDDDVKEKVIAMHMNRPKSDARDKPRLPSPGEISEDPRPFAPGPGMAGRSQGVAPAEAGRDAPPQPKTGQAGGDPGGGPEEFDPDSTDYKAFGRAGNRALPSLVVILKDGSECGFSSCSRPGLLGQGRLIITAA